MSKIKKWNIAQLPSGADADIDRIASELKIHRVTARLLYNRGYRTPEDALNFLRFENELFYDPFMLTDMDKACERILEAIDRHEKIVIYGDYDVDGVTSVSSLYLYLKENGGDVGYYIPNRIGEGYGVNTQALDILAERKTDLLITVDTGITAVKETEYAKSLGMDVIITDHHECHEILPSATAVVNPRRADCKYPFRELAGVGVAFKLITALEYKKRERLSEETEGYLKFICDKYLDLVALGTVADVMPLVDENRLIVKIGLECIDRSKRPGIAALLEQASGGGSTGGRRPGQSRAKKANSTLISYVLAPRVNAAGRISSASRAVDLFLAESYDEATAIAKELCEANRERQTEENKIIEETFAEIDRGYDFENNPVIVLDSDHWHHGIIGIVSSRITEHYNRPSILISFEGEGEDSGIGKGSGRSIRGLNLVDALMSCEDILIKFGGHELAAGLSITRDKLPEFKERINKYAREHLKKEDLITVIDADCELEASEATLNQAAELDLLEPFGVSNPVPLFIMRNVTISEEIPIGSNKHMKFIFEKDGIRLGGVYFGMQINELEYCPGDTVDILFNLNINSFNGVQSQQLVIRDMDFSADLKTRFSEMSNEYRSLRDGTADGISDSDFPIRDDFVKLYLFLRKELKFGGNSMSLGRLVYSLNSGGVREDSICRANYINTKFMIEILTELQIIASETISDRAFDSSDDGCQIQYDKYKFTLNNVSQKVNLDKSCIYKNLKSMTKKQ